MTVPAFSDDWARACAQALNQNSAYRAAAATWEGAIILHMQAPAGERRVLLDLWHGDCRDARAADDEEELLARYVLSGTLTVWRQVLEGCTSPLLAIMTGKLRLTKGALGELVPFAGAAKELVAVVASVSAVWPDST